MNNVVHKSNFFVITGGPGAGKTALIDELKKRGYSCIDEVARQIIKEQVESDGQALPWRNTRMYADLMLARSIESFLENQQRFPTIFFDRGIPDTLAYARLTGMKITPAMRDASGMCRYNPTVFILPAWKEIYRTDTGCRKFQR